MKDSIISSRSARRRRVPLYSLSLLSIALFPSCQALASSTTSGKPRDLPDSVFDTIQQGKIAIVDNYLPASQVTQLRRDAQAIYYDDQKFITDAIAGYSAAAKKQQGTNRNSIAFDPAKDRSVCPAYIPSKQTLGPFVNPNLGSAPALRINTLMNTQIAQLRQDLSVGLDRPNIALLKDGMNNHEVSYTRFGPGAFLKRHTDEHHEELKGPAGWARPTRRSLSWLIYLNEPDWSSEDGGNLRTFPRMAPTAHATGSRQGDLQIGWLTPTRADPWERPVFLDGRRQGESGHCALYIDDSRTTVQQKQGVGIGSSSGRTYLTNDFTADPYLFMSTDWVIQHVLIQNYDTWGHRFHYVEPPKSLMTEFMEKKSLTTTGKFISTQQEGEYVLDVPPTGGTLVMFDSVTLPHQVMATIGRERWAVSGWFHETQQEIPRAVDSVVGKGLPG